MDEVTKNEAPKPVDLEAVAAAFKKVSRALEGLTHAEQDRVMRGVSIVLGLDS
jgi:hypothetical protein